MSIQALNWAFNLDINSSTLKLLLIALADCSCPRGDAYPSIAALEVKTSQNRKTIISGLDELEEMGLLKDTGRRIGKTNQVKIYNLVGLDMGHRHYTYKVSDPITGEFYIGVRSCIGDPIADAAYFGSGTWPLRCLRDGRRLEKEIMATYQDRGEAEFAEQTAIRLARDNSLNRNNSTNKFGRVPKTEPLKSPENGTLTPPNSTVSPPYTVPHTVPKTVPGILGSQGTKNKSARAITDNGLDDTKLRKDAEAPTARAIPTGSRSRREEAENQYIADLERKRQARITAAHARADALGFRHKRQDESVGQYETQLSLFEHSQPRQSIGRSATLTAWAQEFRARFGRDPLPQ